MNSDTLAQPVYSAYLKSAVFAERHLKFCLYRLKASPEIVSAILPYLVERPWLSENIHLYLRKNKLKREAVEYLQHLIATHNVYDIIVALAIETLVRQGVSLRPLHVLFRKWLIDNRRDWPLLSFAAVALGENSDNMSVLLEVISPSYSPSVRRTAIIEALRLSRNKHEAIRVLKLGIHDNAPIVIDALLYQLYVEHGLTIQELGFEANQQPSEYCIACAEGYDSTLPHLQPCYIRYVFTKIYRVKFPEPADFHILLVSEYERAADFLWQAQGSYLTNPSRYVSQLDLFHEELLFSILVDRLNWKNSREEVVKVALPNRMEHLQKNEKQLGVFASSLLDCHHLRASSTEAHAQLYGLLGTTTPVSCHKRDSLKKQLCAAYQQLVDWLSSTHK